MVRLSEETQRFVRAQRLGYVATVCPDGTPNVSPKGSTTVWDSEHLIFADVLSPRTIRNLVEQPAVEVNVVDPLTRKGYRFKGKGTVLRTGPVYWKALEMYKAQGADVRRIRAIVLIEVGYVSPLVSPAYESGTSEEQLRGQWQAYYAAVAAGDVPENPPAPDF